MDPMMMEMIKQLLQTQGGAFGLPGGGNQLSDIFGEVEGFMNQEKMGTAQSRLNVNPLTDIAQFRVNPHKGFLAEEGGMVDADDFENVGSVEYMPPSMQTTSGTIMGSVRDKIAMQALQGFLNGGMVNQQTIRRESFDTINNTPSNLPGRAGGQFELMQELNNMLDISGMKPINNDALGGRLFDNQQPQPFQDGGFVQTLIVDDNEESREYLNRLQMFEAGGSVNKDLVYIPIQFKDGGSISIYGVEKAFLGKLIKGIGKGLGKIGKGIFETAKGSADFLLGNLGMPDVIDNSWVDRSKFLSGANRVIGGLGRTALDFVTPGLGSAIGAAGSMINGLGQNNGQQQSQVGGGMGVQSQLQGSGITAPAGSLFNRINPGGIQAPVVQQPSAGLFTGQFSQPGPYSGIGNLFGNSPFSNGNVTVPGFAGGMFTLPGIGRLGGEVRFNYQEGGEVGLVPIQTEKVGNQPEMIIHIDGTITPVNATKRHSRMESDEVTDILPEGSYIASADKAMKINYKDADEVVIGIKTSRYKEGVQGSPPKEITLASLWPSGDTRSKTPAELLGLLSRKMPIIDRSDKLDQGNDIFTERTNQENLQNRIPYLAEIVALSEKKRMGKKGGNVESFKDGGAVKIEGIPHAQFGDILAKILEFAPTAIPAISSLFGGAQSSRQGAAGVSPLVSTGILSTFPQYQLGVNQNIAAQSGALNQGIEDFSSLGNQLIQNARRSSDIQLGANQQGVDLALQGQQALGAANLGATGLGALSAFSMPTEQERLNLGASRARINNFRPTSASRAAMDALATPQIDQQALAALGPRGAALIAQSESDRMRAANQAAIQRNQFLDQTEQNRIGQLNQLDQQENIFNIGQGGREQELERARNAQLFGSLQQGVQGAGNIQANQFGIQGQGIQRAADLQSGLLGQEGQIQSQILPITTQFALQNAQLAGQPNMLGSQNALNAFTTLGGIQSQNAMAQQLPQNLGGQSPDFGTGPTDSLGNLFRFLGSQMRGGQGMEPLPGIPTLPTPASVNSPMSIPGLGGRPPGVGFATMPTLPNQRQAIPPINALPQAGGFGQIQSQSQNNPFCVGGIHAVTGQPC
jgi:hypothetical protein